MPFPSDLTLPLPPDAHASHLAEWRWLVGAGPWTPVALTRFGDWLLRAADGAVWFLDITSPDFKRVAASLAEAIELAKDESVRDERFLDGIVGLLSDRGVRPGPGQQLGWKVPPVLGAPMAADNAGVFEVGVYQLIASQLGRQTHGNVGRPFTGFTVNGQPPTEPT